MTKKIAAQGEIASFHNVAIQKYFGNDAEIVQCKRFADVFTALYSGQADYAMVAAENSLHGTIDEVFDLLLTYKSWIFGEIYLQIHQNLLALPGAQLHDITEVHSHVAALSQAQNFLDRSLPHAQRLEHADTAGAAADIVRWGDPHKAAIASMAAAEHHNLTILARDIESNRHNYTRFIALGRERMPIAADANKTSIILRTTHAPGSLYHALGAFDKNGINLCLLSSRPIVGQHQSYLFYLDFEKSVTDPSTENALAELRQQGCEVTILGSYRAAELPE